MPLPLEHYLDRDELLELLNRNVADQLNEALDAARISLIDAFCPGGAFDVDSAGEPIASINAERRIDQALEPLWDLQLEFERKGKRR
jgi:hypothetical protein